MRRVIEQASGECLSDILQFSKYLSVAKNRKSQLFRHLGIDNFLRQM